ncbi:unnamed protein product [Absidia cylindrospora]
MTSNRKLNANHDEDSFEFVDYSSVSSFERLTTAIEEVLLSWGINSHSYGVLADNALATLTDHSKHTCISFGAENYKLTYYCHPQVVNLPFDTSASANRPLFLDNYYQFEPPSPPTLDASNEPAAEAVACHPLHRWTGLGRLIVLTPISNSTIGSKLFASSSKSTSIDHSQAKVLLAACALAFNNVRCSVPIFVYQGATRQHGKYSGYSLQHHGRDLEIQFNSKVISPAPRPSHMAYLQSSFIEQLNANRVDNGLPPFSPVERLNISKGAVLTYDLRNWFSANWKLWNDDDEVDLVKTKQKKASTLPVLSFGSYNDPLRTMTLSAVFPLGVDRSDHHHHRHHHHHHQQNHEHHHQQDHDHHHQQDHDHDQHLHLDHHHHLDHDHHHHLDHGQHNQQSRDHHHHLDHNQHNQQSHDHHHHLDHNQHNQQSHDHDHHHYLDHGHRHHHTHDSIAHNNIDALSATYWDLTLEFAPSSQKRALLSTLLENTISSWVTYSSSSRHSLDFHTTTTAITGDDESMGRRHSTRLMQNILHAIGQNKGDDGSTTTTKNRIKSADADIIVTSLFKSNINTTDGDSRTRGKSSNNNNRRRNSMEYIRLRDANADLSIPTPRSLGTRLKFGASVPWRSFLWNFVEYEMDVLQKLDIGSHNTSSSSSSAGMDLLRVCWPKILRQFRWHWENLIPIPNVNPFIYNHHTNSQDGSNLGVDLGYSIVHQKLAMINCCIHQSIKELPTDDHTSPPLASKHKNSSLLFKDLHHDIRTIHCNNNDDLMEGKYSSLSIGTKNDQSTSCTTHSDISESDLYDSMNDDDINGTTTTTTATSIDQRTNKHNRQDTVSKCQQTFAQASSSWSSSISDVSELVRPASTSSIQESFVGLNYSTSAESDPCQHVPSHLSETDDWSTSISKSTPELQDPNAFEGRCHQHESILLLKTKTPLWVPVTQNSGFMTEDMIQQQADTFESLGTSDDATQLRAKLQSAQLESDMQAFKAANPHAVLGDFVKWYSPKDWVEDDDDPSKGSLSARMSHPTNIWQELWKCSRRIPASRQPSLFNLTAEGEKALHYLEHLPVDELFSLLLPTMCLVVYDVLASHPMVKYIRPVAVGLNDFANELVNFPWDALGVGAIEFGTITSMVKQEETLMCNAISLLRKIPKQYDLVERLLVDSRVRLKDDDERTAIFNLYKTEGDTMPKPASIEYVFYMNSSPSIDHPLPQRQYILLKDNKLRQLDMCSIGHHH